ncbi:MAG TPA: YjzD family protein, partial [Trichococcus flocculiformis]|nr:YjzD family protein [Trichococcus flocculiformis]
MKYIAIIFWGFILGQVSVYLGSALSGGSYDFMIATMTGIFTALIVVLVSALMPKTA